MGKSTPVSLFAHITVTSAVSERMDFSSSARSICPCSSTPSQVISCPRFASVSQCFSVAECSTRVVTMCCRSRSMSSAEWIAAFVDSVPQLVNKISDGSHPSSPATRSRACSSALPTCLPKAVAARRIAIQLGEKRQHLLDHSGVHARGRVVVEIDEFAALHGVQKGAQNSAPQSGTPTEVSVIAPRRSSRSQSGDHLHP